LVDLLATQQPRIEKDTALLAHAQGLSAADLAIHQDPGLAWQGLKSSIDSLVGTTGESVRAADLLTQAAQALSRYTEGLTKESAAQAKGAPSPGTEETNRHINRLVFGEDSAESGLDLIQKKLGWLMHPSQWLGRQSPRRRPPARSRSLISQWAAIREAHRPGRMPISLRRRRCKRKG
jgi:hypothetical protein